MADAGRSDTGTGPSATALPPGERADAEQLEASDPRVSAFVSANAGTGKTKLLIDRLLRLMLPDGDRPGADPARIQCLTFTKAAAAEMAIRLHARLGEWVTLDPVSLDAELRRLHVPVNASARTAARALFARVLDLPGGMRIGTIHAFCQSLLRRFPLEAELSPHFRLMEQRDARLNLDTARESEVATADPALLAALAGLVTADGFAGLLGGLQGARERLAPLLGLAPAERAAAFRRRLGVAAADEAELIAAAVAWPEETALRAALLATRNHGPSSARNRAEHMLGWLNDTPAGRAARWAEWRGYLFNKDGSATAPSKLCGPRFAADEPMVAERYVAEQERLAAIEDARRALHLAQASAALVDLAAPILGAYSRRKASAGFLEYEDLIGHTSRLLRNPGVAWVLYKLDGGLDHLLLDEVQDTSPAQWEIAGALTEEFFAGAGAQETATRTVFAVGDRKQSIFSFQGADPAQFERWRGIFRDRAHGARCAWRDTTLDVSFRSTAPILQLVDAVFSEPVIARRIGAEAIGESGPTTRHLAQRAGHAGRVELWPLVPAPEAPQRAAWSIPDRNHGLTNAPQRLADQLGDWIAAATRGDTPLESEGRPLEPGDVLVLVSRRDDIGRALVRRLKALHVPVAGLDRLVLTDQPAVQDLMALCEALLLPQDDLTLATLLTSPLGFLGDESLMELAAGRGEATLWDRLRDRAGERPEWQAAHDFFARLLARTDYATPHALLIEALGPLGGRARLLRRLGPEAAEPIDELLHAALTHAATHPPALQDFLHWLRESGAEVKREPENAGNLVRVMTVHGAKGLEAPLVILPDTTRLPPDADRITWVGDPASGVELPLWTPRKELQCRALEEIRRSREAERLAEYHRLLYVALTRARDRLIICGWATRSATSEDSWYRLTERGLRQLGAEACPAPDGGTILVHQCPQTAPPRRAAAASAGPSATLPAWLGQAPDWRPAPLPSEAAPPQPLAPSRPEGITLGAVPQALSPLAGPTEPDRLRRGLLLHTLLQHLPELPRAARHEAASAFASRPAHGLSGAETAALVAEALAVIEDPSLAPLFGPESRAEQPLVGLVGAHVISGQVDRLAVLPEAVIVADFKTGRAPPETADATPVLYLRQMAAYRALLRALYPERAVRCVLIWTEAPRAIELPDALLDAHAPDTPPRPGPSLGGLADPRPTAVMAPAAGEAGSVRG